MGMGLLILMMAAIMIGGVIWVGRSFFGQHVGNEPEISSGQKLLNEPTDKTVARLSVRGPITAEEEHYSIVISVGPTSRSLVIFRGYNGETMENVTLGNSEKSFKDFVAALNRASFMKESNNTDGNQGICAVGQLLQFEMLNNDKSAEKLWSTSCPNLTGNFGGLQSNVIDLFLGQIPTSRSLINKAKRTLDQEHTDTNLNVLY